MVRHQWVPPDGPDEPGQWLLVDTGRTVPWLVVAAQIGRGAIEIAIFIFLVVMLLGAKLLGLRWGDPS